MPHYKKRGAFRLRRLPPCLFVSSFFVSSLFVASLLALNGCGASQTTVLGIAPASSAPVTVQQASLNAKADPVMLQGEMIEKCPVAGCWFKLRDTTGVVRVDTKDAGFVVSDVPLHTRITVQGRIVPGVPASVAATGIRY